MWTQTFVYFEPAIRNRLILPCFAFLCFRWDMQTTKENGRGIRFRLFSRILIVDDEIINCVSVSENVGTCKDGLRNKVLPSVYYYYFFFKMSRGPKFKFKIHVILFVTRTCFISIRLKCERPRGLAR